MVIPRGVHLQASPLWQRRKSWHTHPRPDLLCPCGAVAEKKPGLPRCEVCRAETAAYKLCRGCGGKRPCHINSIYCPACVSPGPPRSARGNVIRPCLKCGSREPKQRGEVYCPECTDLMREVRDARYRARLVKARMPCRGCGGAKGSGGHGNVYCAACQRERNPPRTCQGERCSVEIPRGDRHRLCASCRVRRLRESRQRSRERLRADPVRLAAQREYQRTYERQRAREQHVRDRRRKGGGPRPAGIPAKPLGVAVLQAAGDSVTTLAESLGTSDRSIRKWRGGEPVGVETADRVLGQLFLNWWEVWDPERFPDLYSPEEWVDVVRQVSAVFPGERVVT